MPLPGNKRVASRVGVGGHRASSYFVTAAGSGPGGSGTMTFFTVFRVDRMSAVVSSGAPQTALHGRYNLASGNGGYLHTLDSRSGIVGIWTWWSYNEANITTGIYTPGASVMPTIVGRPVVLVSVMNDTLGVNRVIEWSSIGGTTAPSGVNTASFVSAPAGARYGIGAWTTAGSFTNGQIFDCGVLYGWDAELSYVSSTYGNGIAGFGAQIVDDMEQGRDVTWPRAGVANQDWYFTARDVVLDTSCRTTWPARYTTSLSIPRTGQPQGCAARMAF